MEEFALVALLTIVAAGVGTLTGFGTSTVMVPVMLLYLPFSQVLLLVGIVHWFGNVWKITLFREGVRWRLILLFGIPGAVVTFLAAKLVFVFPEGVMHQAIGALLVIYVLYLFFNPRFRLPQKASTALAGGVSYGFLAGVSGIGGEVRGAFLSAYNLPKSVYIATAGAIGLAVDTSRLASYLQSGSTLTPELWWGMLAFIPASLVGAYGAKLLVDRIPQGKFRATVAVFLLLVGLKLLIWT